MDDRRQLGGATIVATAGGARRAARPLIEWAGILPTLSFIILVRAIPPHYT
eukprot:COSAG05_NODE_2175_length_3437_cov_25.916417_6_plen_51_part_00